MRKTLWLAALAASSWTAPAWAQMAMPAGEQNALVRKHCAVCHNDAAKNGGLTLQRFDGATVAPSLAAMMLSKLTSGLPLEKVMAATDESATGAQVSKQLQGGAIMAAGIAPPDPAVTLRLALTLAAQAAGATTWHAGSRPQAPVVA